MPIAQDMKNITEEIEVSYGERMSWLSELGKDTHQLLSRFKNEHKGMIEDLATFLGESTSTRKANVKKMMSDVRETISSIQTRQREREEEVASLIKKFKEELDEMATELKALLSQSESKRLEEFKSMLAAIKSKQRAREEEVAELLAAFQKDISEARNHWQNLAKIMASKRTGKRVPIAEVPKEAEVPKRVEEAAEEAFGQGELKTKALALIEESPKGIGLKQLGNKLRVPYIRLAKPIKELLDEGKVVKKDSLYFLASAEA